MNKLIALLIAALLFAVIYFFLCPLIPQETLRIFTQLIVVFIAIIYALTLAVGGGDGPWPWSKQ